MKHKELIVHTIVTVLITVLIMMAIQHRKVLFSSGFEMPWLFGNASSTSGKEDTQESELEEDEIVDLVLGRIPGAGRENIIRLDYESLHGISQYKGMAVMGKNIYRFEIDATTGTILDWEVDY